MSKTLRSAGSAALAFAFTAGLISLIAAEPATAQAIDPDVRTEQVSIRGLDLATSAGQHRLDARVDRAIRRMCFDGTDRLITREELACRAAARASVAPQIAMLTARAERLAASGGASGSGKIALASARN